MNAFSACTRPNVLLPAMAAIPVAFHLFCLLVSIVNASLQNASSICPPALFVFGDSLSDTGNDYGAFAKDPSYENYHHGQTYFGHFQGRLSDGRLLVDFAAQAFGFPLLPPYVGNIEPNYEHGVSFAWGGATARASTIMTPFHLAEQVNQFLYFQKNLDGSTFNSLTGPPNLQMNNHFRRSWYFICIGINDLWQNLYNKKMTIEEVELNIIPDAIQAVAASIEKLYTYGGARNFIIVNVPAFGCLPRVLSNFGGEYDSNGCLTAYNNLTMSYNNKLKEAAVALRKKFRDAFIVYADYFQLYVDTVSNPTAYGFRWDKRLSACCGEDGGYKSPLVPCRFKNTSVCTNPSEYISWDGIHFTEGFTSFVAQSFLTGDYLDPYINMSASCSLDFSDFPARNYSAPDSSS